MSAREEAIEFWKRAVEALALAQVGVKIAPDGAANRSYFAAFHAASAMFVLEGKIFTRHSALESAIHKELVHTGRWDKELGTMYGNLHNLRNIGDYGDLRHVTQEEAATAVSSAFRILETVHKTYPDIFPLQISSD